MSDEETLIPCSICGRGFPPDEILRYRTIDGPDRFYCPDCWKGVRVE